MQWWVQWWAEGMVEGREFGEVQVWAQGIEEWKAEGMKKLGPTQLWSNQRLRVSGTVARTAALPGGGIGAAIANHSGSRGGDVEQKANANGGGRQRPDDCLASTRRESPLPDADAHGGRTTSSNDMTNKVGGAGVSTYNNQPKSSSDSDSDSGSDSGSDIGSI